MDSRHQTELNNNRSKRIASNTLVLFARMLIITCVNLYSVRWVLNGLGTIDYGIFNAVAGVVTASSCISSVLALSTQRFYSYAMGQGNHEQLKEIFTVSLQIVAILSAIIIIIFELLGPWFVSAQLTIPAERLGAASWVLQFSLFSFIFTLLQIPFIGAIFSNENMGIYAIASTLDCIVKLFIAYMIGKTNADNLIFYGAAMMSEAFLLMVFYMLVAYHKYPECKYQKVKDKTLYKQLFAFSGWTFYGTISSMGMTQGSIVLLNIFFGPIINAAFNIANQIYNAINTLANTINIAIRPSMIKTYSSHNEVYLNKLFIIANKALLYLLIMFSIPLIFELEGILQLWLGNYTPEMVLFSRLYIIFTIILCLHNPITTIIQATGNIKKYILYVESLTILNVPICWIIFKMGMPSYLIFVIMISLGILAHIMRLIILNKANVGFKYKSYIFHFLLPGIAVILINSIIAYILHSHINNSMIRICTTFAVSPLFIIISTYFLGMNKTERETIKKYIKR